MIRPTVASSQLTFFLLFPTFQTVLLMSSIALFLLTLVTFLRLKLSRVTIIAANIGKAMVKLKLWLSKSSSLHIQLHGSRGLISQSLACESHTLPLRYHATSSAIILFINDKKDSIVNSKSYLYCDDLEIVSLNQATSKQILKKLPNITISRLGRRSMDNNNL